MSPLSMPNPAFPSPLKLDSLPCCWYTTSPEPHRVYDQGVCYNSGAAITEVERIQMSPLLELNDDVLDLLLETARRARSIVPLSATCRRIRWRSLPILFRKHTIASFGQVKTFLPATLRQFVTTLLLIDFCGDVPPVGVDETSEEWALIAPSLLRYTDDTRLCGVYNSKTLADVLLQMPRLHTVEFRFPSLTYPHGIPWPVLKHILSLPSLQELCVDMHRFAPMLSDREQELTLDFPIKLTSFSHTLSDYHRRSVVFPTERQALELVIKSSSSSLRRLTVAMELAPLDLLYNGADWSNLRELHLRGQYRTIGDPPLPLIAVFGHMPHLRVLDLKLIQPAGLDPQPIWPPGHHGEWPWRELEELTVSCPQIEDNTYGALPTTLRGLCLRYTPHCLNHLWRLEDGLPGRSADCRWQWPLLPSADILGILRRSDVPRLRHLELEYEVDDSELDLLDSMAERYPGLTSIHLFRCRKSRNSHPTQDFNPTDYVRRLIKPLTSLTNLEKITLHLDLPGTPRPQYVPTMRFGGSGPYTLEELEEFSRVLQAIADMLARMLRPSLKTITLWKPAYNAVFEWRIFDVVCDDGEWHAPYVDSAPRNYAYY
ncbi:hypothetical protein C8Q73DRAFT_305367 [Cubamyces lactineus]|nr:hypothetical protein C8Q73DRAFT_305367 [Cubamyces lactineus]